MATTSDRYSVGAAGLIYVGITLLLGIGALNSDNNLLYLACSIGLAALVVSAFFTMSMMSGLQVTRLLPDAGAVNRPIPMTYQIRNRNRYLPAFALHIDEGVRATKGSKPTWPRHVSPVPVFASHVGPGRTICVPALRRGRRRGQCVFVSIRVSSSFPFGLIRRTVTVAETRAIDIHPEIGEVRRDLLAGVIVQGNLSQTATSRRGDGIDFFGLREYQPGDSLRRVAWRRSAKLDEMITREHVSSATGRLWVFLDLPEAPSAKRESDSERAITLAASLLADALALGQQVGLIAPTQGVLIPLGSGAMQRSIVLTALARLDLSRAATGLPGDERSLAALTARAPCLVIHGQDLDPSVGPSGAAHLTSDDLDHLTLPPHTPAPTALGAAGATISAEREAVA